MLRLAFFFNSRSTLGHATVTYSLVKLFKKYFKDKIKILVIADGDVESRIFPFSKFAKLYSLTPAQGSYDIKKIKNRASLIKNTLFHFKPDILITEYFPFNRDYLQHVTFPSIAESLKKHFHTKIMSSCFYPNCSDNTYNHIKNFYDLILFHLPEKLLYEYSSFLPLDGAEALNAILKQFRKRIFFTGFLIDSSWRKDSTSRIKKRLGIGGNQKLIILSRGGRTEYNKLIIYSILLARSHPEWVFLISAGSSISNTEYKKFQFMAKGLTNVNLSKIIYPDFDNYLKAADLSINMGGYNTAVRLLKFRKKAIIFPVENTDQDFNAYWTKLYLRSEIIIEKDIKPALLENNIRYLLNMQNEKKEHIDEKWFGGLENTLNIIKNITKN